MPSLVTPISPKRGLYKLLAFDYILIAGFYLLLGFTGIFAFPHLEDLYTLNFIPSRCPTAPPGNVSTGVVLSLLPEGKTRFVKKMPILFLNIFFNQ